MKSLIWLVFLCALLFSLTYTKETYESPPPQIPQTIHDFIIIYSSEYEVSDKLLRRVIKAESNLKCNPRPGDGGRANGPAQFHRPTFDAFAKEFGEELDYHSCHDQIKLMAWAFAQGEKYRWHWTTYRRIAKSL